MLRCCAVGLVGSLALACPDLRADLEISGEVVVHSAADFDAPLAPYGTWIEVDAHGRCWHPAHVEVGWRPYASGYWTWTDCGWYWNSDEPWAWACYHYGSWVSDPNLGWVWVPGTIWGPAWVSWRFGGGYVGWAPLPPHGWFSRPEPAPSAFVFVAAPHFSDPVRPRSVIVNDTAVLKKTTSVGEARRETKNFGGSSPQRVMVNEGPGLEAIQRAGDAHVRHSSIQEIVRRMPTPHGFHGARGAENGKPPPAAEPPRISPGPKGDPGNIHERRGHEPRDQEERGKPRSDNDNPASPGLPPAPPSLPPAPNPPAPQPPPFPVRPPPGDEFHPAPAPPAPPPPGHGPRVDRPAPGRDGLIG